MESLLSFIRVLKSGITEKYNDHSPILSGENWIDLSSGKEKRVPLSVCWWRG